MRGNLVFMPALRSIVYKPAGLVLGAAAGALASAAFRQVWRRVAGEDEAPDATDRDYGWTEVLLAAVIQGAIFAGVRAAVNRAGAEGVRKLTGHWPD